MRLHNVAKRADTTELTDAYSGKIALMAQVSAYIDNQSDGTISKRRVISFSPDSVLPERRVVSYYGETWIVGDKVADIYRGTPIRYSAAASIVTGIFEKFTPAQAANRAVGLKVYGQHSYLRDTVDGQTTSEYFPQWQIYLARPETLAEGTILKLDSQWFRIRSAYTALDGFTCGNADELPEDTEVSVAFNGESVYNPVTNDYTVSTINTYALFFDAFQLYKLGTEADPRIKAGDKTLIVAKTEANPSVGQTLTIDGRKWNILGKKSEQDAWNLHIRVL